MWNAVALDEMRRLWKFADEMGFDWFDQVENAPGTDVMKKRSAASA